MNRLLLTTVSLLLATFVLIADECNGQRTWAPVQGSEESPDSRSLPLSLRFGPSIGQYKLEDLRQWSKNATMFGVGVELSYRVLRSSDSVATNYTTISIPLVSRQHDIIGHVIDFRNCLRYICANKEVVDEKVHRSIIEGGA